MPEEFTKIPAHIAIIMDGNGRWAKTRGLPRLEGHRMGTETLRVVIRACVEFGVKYLTVYAFSTENWSRPSDEVNGLMMLLESVVENELDELDKEGVQIRHIGRLEALPEGLRDKVKHAIVQTRNNQKIILNIAWNYGGRDEIVYAVQQLVAAGTLPEEINEEVISRHLFTSQSPDPDLVIRTSGEYRISNFMIWQSAYSEWVFTPVLWPDFNKEELRKAILEYGQRDRRFGKVCCD
jgi:undecaprenyl diphosphate synthase